MELLKGAWECDPGKQRQVRCPSLPPGLLLTSTNVITISPIIALPVDTPGAMAFEPRGEDAAPGMVA